ncbi:MAG: hypothetical protein OEO77_04375 [Acidimicrobiia bacterium]|nr:hypothetical protein [Acidimicrobiia bacterium]
MVRLAPMTVGEVLDAAIKVLRVHWRPILGTAALAFLPVAALSWYVNQAAFASLAQATDFADFGRFFRLLIPTLAATAIGTLITKSVAIFYVDAFMGGRRPAYGDILAKTAKRFPALLVNRLIVWVMTGLGALFCLLPGLWIGVSWSMSHPALLLEGQGPMDALGRSYKLVRNRWWPLFGWAFVLWATSSALDQLGAAAIQGLLWTDAGDKALLAISTVSDYLSQTALWSVVGTSGAVMLIDLKVRREAYDLELITESLSTAAASAPRPSQAPPPPLPPPDDNGSDWMWTPPSGG